VATTLAKSNDHIHVHMLMLIMLLIFCCTLPYPLACTFGKDRFYSPSLVVAFTFFGLNAAAWRMGTPFGHDEAFCCQDFKVKLTKVCNAVCKEQPHWCSFGSSEVQAPLRGEEVSLQADAMISFSPRMHMV